MLSPSSPDSLAVSRRGAAAGGGNTASLDLESQRAGTSFAFAAPSASSSSSVGLARRMSPKLHPLPYPHAASSSSVAASRHQPASALPAVSTSPVRYLLLFLVAVGCVALLGVGWDHSALVRSPSVVCFDGSTCVPAERNQPTSQATSQQSAVASSAATAAAPATVPNSSTVLGPPYYDSLPSLLACPALASILAANGIRAVDEAGTAALIPIDQPQLRGILGDYERQLETTLSAAQLTFDDWRSSEGRLTMAHYYQQHAGADLVTSSTRNTNYTISAWSNICLTYGGDKDPHLVLLGSDVAAQQQLIDTQLLHPDHQQFSWVPPRWCNDQGRLRAQAKADDDWLWIPAEQGTAAFHQFEWDFNVGHQFHQQVWPLFTATQSESPQQFGSPTVTRAMIDSACRDDGSSMGVRHSAWKPINQFFGRLVLHGVKDRVSVMRQSCAAGTLPSGVCFERLALNDGKDQYLDRGGAASFDSFRRFRSLILRALQFEPPLFPDASALPSTPLRVTIYSRHDSSRRRIMNVDELTAALSPHHIVRHVPSFGQRPPHEQLALYANTDLLIAPHGAHMTFAFLLPTNAIVVEAFAHEEGKFSWTVNFLRGSAHN